MDKKIINIEELNILLAKSESGLSIELKNIWTEIKIEPELWFENVTSRSYWAIAIIDREVVWYNDTENGFNISKFNELGTIGEYWSDQCPLEDLLWHLF